MEITYTILKNLVGKQEWKAFLFKKVAQFMIKFMFSKKAQKLAKSSPSIWRLLSKMSLNVIAVKLFLY